MKKPGNGSFEMLYCCTLDACICINQSFIQGDSFILWSFVEYFVNIRSRKIISSSEVG